MLGFFSFFEISTPYSMDEEKRKRQEIEAECAKGIDRRAIEKEQLERILLPLNLAIYQVLSFMYLIDLNCRLGHTFSIFLPSKLETNLHFLDIKNGNVVMI